MSRPPDSPLPTTDDLSWLSGGGEMGALIRSMDWSATPLGPLETWPQSLRTSVSLCLSSTFPILIAWGPERVQIYNDSSKKIAICEEYRGVTSGEPTKIGSGPSNACGYSTSSITYR